MERSTVDLGVSLHEEILLDDPPSGIGDIFHCFLIFFRDILPAEECAVLADSVNLLVKKLERFFQLKGFLGSTYHFLCRIEIGGHHALSVSR